ncbi:MAG TPA: hypothetical protein PKC21_05175 [Oligoflexia bacterium]|nr:hypothetical protein [Oligoflexia bacterium]HMR24728.1 hypothetical protein [Oligoflexia bacterium]
MNRIPYSAQINRISKMVLLLTFFLVLSYAANQLPKFGDPQSPASNHVSPHYIEHGYEQTGGPNLVTDVLADYRSLDTLFETAVIFTSALACLLILGFRRDNQQ